MRIVFVTLPPDGAPAFLRQLLEERLVACGNILPGVRSLYHWKGQIQDDQESVLLMETSDDRVPALMARIRQIHPYEVPKVLTLEPREGLEAYLEWVEAETHAGG